MYLKWKETMQYVFSASEETVPLDKMRLKREIEAGGGTLLSDFDETLVR